MMGKKFTNNESHNSQKKMRTFDKITSEKAFKKRNMSMLIDFSAKNILNDDKKL